MKIEASEQIQCLVDSQIFESLLSPGRCPEQKMYVVSASRFVGETDIRPVTGDTKMELWGGPGRLRIRSF